ncbi:MAG: [acyl-carrier-protein] S-malonyltransferase [Halobacteriovoraceae bacterium]|nr:[acyl-carrier-protein] S-malonyltransferase [Halobacteriovoraceae bacterium]
MKKIICLFPGQGSQYVGMGKSFLESDITDKIFKEAEESLGFSIKNIMLEGPEEKLKETQYTQPAILTHSWIIYNQLKKMLSDKGLKIDCVLGHSVGEYSALTAAETLSFKDAVKAVNLRGKFMQEATPIGTGAMYAILKVPMETIEKGCTAVSTKNSVVMPANINSSNQVVVSGHKEACENFVSWLKENYQESFKAVPLQVSAPFHSSLMKPAEEKLATFFNEISFDENQYSYVDNLTAKLNDKNTSPDLIREKLIGQVSGTVKWEESLKLFKPEECLFLEVGPGKTLMGIARSIDRKYKVTPLDIENMDEKLGEIL